MEKSNELKPLSYLDVNRIDNVKYYLNRIINKSIPSELEERIHNAAVSLSSVKLELVNFFISQSYEESQKD